MSVRGRLAAFALAAGMAFVAGLGLGTAAGPFDDGEPAPASPHEVHP